MHVEKTNETIAILWGDWIQIRALSELESLAQRTQSTYTIVRGAPNSKRNTTVRIVEDSVKTRLTFYLF